MTGAEAKDGLIRAFKWGACGMCEDKPCNSAEAMDGPDCENLNQAVKRFVAQIDRLNLAVAEPCPNRCVHVRVGAHPGRFFVDPLPKGEKT